MKMFECEECGKKLGILGNYRHPTMGKKHHLCGYCFDLVSESVRQWGEFVRNNSFNVNNSTNNIKVDWKKIIPNSTQILESFDNFWTGNEINMER
jgi:hypothetical protein